MRSASFRGSPATRVMTIKAPVGTSIASTTNGIGMVVHAAIKRIALASDMETWRPTFAYRLKGRRKHRVEFVDPYK